MSKPKEPKYETIPRSAGALAGNGRRIYIAGKMTGVPEFNFPAFFAAQDNLRGRGWRTINPAAHDLELGFDWKGTTGNEKPENFNLTDALLWDLNEVAHADAVYMLHGWEDSKGANAEIALARALGKQIIFQEAEPRLFGIGGKLGSGKDTLADHLVATHSFVKLNMSEPLHEAMLALNPLIGDSYRYSEAIAEFGYTKAKKITEVRQLLQRLGTELGRKIIGENTWVDIAGRRVDALMNEGKSVVITGIRFPNELQMISRRSGTLVWVQRDTDAALGGHASEQSVGAHDFDQLVLNMGTIADLQSCADGLLA